MNYSPPLPVDDASIGVLSTTGWRPNRHADSNVDGSWVLGDHVGGIHESGTQETTGGQRITMWPILCACTYKREVRYVHKGYDTGDLCTYQGCPTSGPAPAAAIADKN